MITIDRAALDALTVEAKQSPRKRKNRNYHPELSDTLQRLLNAMEPGTYVQPHKHENPDKREVFAILSGRALVVEFDGGGAITDHAVLDPAIGNYIVEIPARAWHTVQPLDSGTVLYEVKDGPYQAVDDKNFAPWAPAEGDADCAEYNRRLLKRLGIL